MLTTPARLATVAVSVSTFTMFVIALTPPRVVLVAAGKVYSVGLANVNSLALVTPPSVLILYVTAWPSSVIIKALPPSVGSQLAVP